MTGVGLPVVLVVDDLFGRTVVDGGNGERADLCGKLLLRDVTGDAACGGASQRVLRPIAAAVFCRGQVPGCASVGDVVRNDLGVALGALATGPPASCGRRWALVAVDLCFRTGRVTRGSDASCAGMPEGAAGDREALFGVQVLEAVRGVFPEVPVVVLSGQTPVAAVREAIARLGSGFVDRSSADASERLLAWIEGRRGAIPG